MKRRKLSRILRNVRLTRVIATLASLRYIVVSPLGRIRWIALSRHVRKLRKTPLILTWPSLESPMTLKVLLTRKIRLVALMSWTLSRCRRPAWWSPRWKIRARTTCRNSLSRYARNTVLLWMSLEVLKGPLFRKTLRKARLGRPLTRGKRLRLLSGLMGFGRRMGSIILTILPNTLIRKTRTLSTITTCLVVRLRRPRNGP